ncbi:MAG: hypothetical protein ACI936_001038, partial [Paraglaciecola sp.]
RNTGDYLRLIANPNKSCRTPTVSLLKGSDFNV